MKILFARESRLNFARLISGRILYVAWILRKRFALRKRPLLLKFLKFVKFTEGIYLASIGILLGWFSERLVPARLSAMSIAPWSKTTSWICGICLFIVGSSGAISGCILDTMRLIHIRISLLECLVLLSTGIILVCSGIRFGAKSFLVFGLVSLFMVTLSNVLLLLTWYTLDPLGLHTTT